MSNQIADRKFLLANGFTENPYSFDKGEFILMKTSLELFYEVIYKKLTQFKITVTAENVCKAYKKCTGEELKNLADQSNESVRCQEYYSGELKKLKKSEFGFQIKITDSDGNKTNFLKLNKVSLMELIKFYFDNE